MSDRSESHPNIKDPDASNSFSARPSSSAAHWHNVLAEMQAYRMERQERVKRNKRILEQELAISKKWAMSHESLIYQENVISHEGAMSQDKVISNERKIISKEQAIPQENLNITLPKRPITPPSPLTQEAKLDCWRNMAAEMRRYRISRHQRLKQISKNWAEELDASGDSDKEELLNTQKFVPRKLLGEDRFLATKTAKMEEVAQILDDEKVKAKNTIYKGDLNK